MKITTQDSKVFFNGCVNVEYVYTMKAIQRNTRIKWHNPTGELVNIICHKINVYKRYKRRYPKSRYDIGAI